MYAHLAVSMAKLTKVLQIYNNSRRIRYSLYIRCLLKNYRSFRAIVLR